MPFLEQLLEDADCINRVRRVTCASDPRYTDEAYRTSCLEYYNDQHTPGDTEQNCTNTAVICLVYTASDGYFDDRLLSLHQCASKCLHASKCSRTTEDYRYITTIRHCNSETFLSFIKTNIMLYIP